MPAAFFPMPAAPVYAAAKAGVVHLTRSAAPTLAWRGIRAMAVCPEFVDTALVRDMVDRGGGVAKAVMGKAAEEVSLLTPEQVQIAQGPSLRRATHRASGNVCGCGMQLPHYAAASA